MSVEWVMYIGQCDILRKTPEGESNWQAMIANAKPTTLSIAATACDLSVLCDEDESPAQLLNDWKRQDPTTAAYYSNWGPHSCVFFQTCGFEFIFRIP